MSSSTAKFGFRPRALDVTKKLPIRIIKCRKKSPKVKRTAAVAPTGMEKEEEMESHLQQALIAQKATSAGDTVENHVIPTPKVLSIKPEEYDRIYQQQRRFQKSKKLIIFKDYVPFFLTQGSYNADSEDEEWLSTRRNINPEDFEHIIEKLETTSQTDIIKPREARALLQRYDFGFIDDIYDYWLQKRQKAASKKSKCSVLIPKVCTEARREEKTLVNPYIAFRRRVDKVQTRKKQKTELMTYEKMLQINFCVKRSIVLISALAQREKLKKTDCDLSYLMFQMQYKKRISNEEMDQFTERVKQQQQQAIGTMAAGSRREQLLPHAIAAASSSCSSQLIRDFELPDEIRHKASLESTLASGDLDDKCLQRNLELWNSAAQIAPFYGLPSVSDDSTEVEKIAAVEQNSIVDGRYQFKRKYGCRYRAPGQQPSPPPSDFPSPPMFDDFSRRSIPFTNAHRVGLVGKRLGRGGRLCIDLLYMDSSPPPPNSNNKNQRISSNM